MKGREGVWLVEGRWIEGADREWGIVLDHGPYPDRKEARATARMIADEALGGHLYRARFYIPAPPPPARNKAAPKRRATKGKR